MSWYKPKPKPPVNDIDVDVDVYAKDLNVKDAHVDDVNVKNAYIYQDNSVDKSVDLGLGDIDGDKKVKVMADVDVDADVDVSTKHEHIDIDIKAVDKDPDTTIKYVDETVEKTTYTETVKVKEDWDVDVDVKSNNIVQGSDADNIFLDVNDVELNGLISNDYKLDMEDFDLDVTTIGGSFNGGGNDGMVDNDQSNNLKDNDDVHNTTATYTNAQAPDITGATVKAGFEAGIAGGSYAEGGAYEYEASKGKTTEYYDDIEIWGKKVGQYEDPYKSEFIGASKEGGGFYAAGGHFGAAAIGAGLFAHADSIAAPDAAFETVTARGGTAKAGDGIDGASLNGILADAEGDVTIVGDALADASASASASSFDVSVATGGNTQVNTAVIETIGGNSLDAGDIGFGQASESGGISWKGYGDYSKKPYGEYEMEKGGDLELDGGDKYTDGHVGGNGLAVKDSWIHGDIDVETNDLDLDDLIDNDAPLYMEDFDLDISMIGDSFNGAGNDFAYDNSQANDLVDNDNVTGTSSAYNGSFWNGAFQEVTAAGGTATSGDGVNGLHGNHSTLEAGGDIAIAGSTSALAAATASASAFNVDVVVGANLQQNGFGLTIVGNDSAVVDDVAGDAIL